MNRHARPFLYSFVLFALFFAAAGSCPSGENDKRDLAICVGIGGAGRYFAENSAEDASGVAAALENHGSFRRVVTMTDADGAPAKSLPTRKNLLAVAKLVANAAGAGDSFFVYISAPASLDGGELRIVPAGDPDGEHVPLREMLDILHGSAGVGGMVVLDVRVPELGEADEPVPPQLPEYQNMAIVLYRSDGEAAADGDSEQQGLLALGLAKAILFADDPDGDGAMSAGEIYERVHRHVTDYYLENLILDSHAPEISAGGRAVPALRIAASPGEDAAAAGAAETDGQAEAAIADADDGAGAISAETAVVAEPEAVVVAAGAPELYTDPSTGRVFRYDEAKRDWVLHSDTTYAQPAYHYQQPQQQYYQQQQRYHQPQQQRSGGMSPGAAANAASIFGSIASFLIGP